MKKINKKSNLPSRQDWQKRKLEIKGTYQSSNLATNQRAQLHAPTDCAPSIC